MSLFWLYMLQCTVNHDTEDKFYRKLRPCIRLIFWVPQENIVSSYQCQSRQRRYFKMIIVNKNVLEISKDNWAGAGNLPRPKLELPTLQCSTIPIHKHTWTSRGGNTFSQIDHTVIDRRRCAVFVYIGAFRGGDRYWSVSARCKIWEDSQ